MNPAFDTTIVCLRDEIAKRQKDLLALEAWATAQATLEGLVLPQMLGNRELLNKAISLVLQKIQAMNSLLS